MNCRGVPSTRPLKGTQMTKYVQQPENSLSSSRMKGAFFAPPTCACAVRIKMAAKRGADKLLTQDNWDQEEEDEELGHFKVASTEDLSKRKIIKAKRRVTSDSKGGGVFQGFSGFAGLNNNSKSSFAASALSIKPLTGLSSLTPASKNMFSGLNASSAEASTSTASSFTSLGSNKNGFKASSSDDAQATKASSGSSYNDNLKALNESVAAWIQKHIAVNPYVDLTPIFNDYKEHMKNIDLRFSSSTMETDKPSSAPVAFNTTKQPASSEKQSVESQPGTSGEENTEEQVPKPKSVVVAEEGAFHSIRCKLFFKRESTWAELGIGMLNLKKLEGKTQLLVRNDTTLGKILVNVYLARKHPL
ncbi:Nuclear pore complex protein Nup50 [Desmophyllum pertusum]|uniref:Nuclear pore complex protein Nup50 n=1 Tax=Desmophyllum pertusum TaxID=174260 RepID=A0A9X0CPT0_9CNID|nr:Nuclear pore complex protein Nup50 [Desmophyllum pertusum]